MKDRYWYCISFYAIGMVCMMISYYGFSPAQNNLIPVRLSIACFALLYIKYATSGYSKEDWYRRFHPFLVWFCLSIVSGIQFRTGQDILVNSFFEVQSSVCTVAASYIFMIGGGSLFTGVLLWLIYFITKQKWFAIFGTGLFLILLASYSFPVAAVFYATGCFM
jgi:hypothetical protein